MAAAGLQYKGSEKAGHARIPSARAAYMQALVFPFPCPPLYALLSFLPLFHTFILGALRCIRAVLPTPLYPLPPPSHLGCTALHTCRASKHRQPFPVLLKLSCPPFNPPPPFLSPL